MVKVEHHDSRSDEEENSPSVETFRCHICQDVMIDPTSVTCGHTFCRLCLAKWSLIRNQPVCAVCQQHWSGLPKVNIILRDAIKESLPDSYASREREHLAQSAVIQRFDNLVSRLVQRERQMVQEQSRNRAEHEYIVYVMKNILPYVGISLVVIIFYNWFQRGGTLVKQPVLSWTEVDCLQWLEGEGDWTEPIQDEFGHHEVDGVYLLGISRNITKVDAEQLLKNVDNWDERRDFRAALAYIKATGSIPPSNFWEYKDVYILKTTWTVAFASLCPRLVAFYLYLFDYDAAFLPAVNITSPRSEEGAIDKYTLSVDAASNQQINWFLFKLLLCPSLVYSHLTLDVIWPNAPLAALAIWIQCICYLYMEIDFFLKFVEFQWARVDLLKDGWNNLYRFHYTTLMFVMLYYLAPSSVSSIFFSVMFFNCVYLRITEVVVSFREVPRHLTQWYSYLRIHSFTLIKEHLTAQWQNKINNLSQGLFSLVISIKNIGAMDLSNMFGPLQAWCDGLSGRLHQTVTYLKTNGYRDVMAFCNSAYGYGLYIRTRLQGILPSH